MHSTLLSFLTLWKPLGYVLAFLGMIFEGDIFLFTVGFLTNQGFFDIGDIFLTVMLGVIFGDILWYRWGAYLKISSSKIEKWIERVTSPFDEHIQKRLFHTVFLSKFAYGLHHPILMRIGALGVKFRKFVLDDFIAILFWVFIVGGLGYASSASFSIVKKYLKFGEIVILFVILFFLIIPTLLLRRHIKQHSQIS